MNVLEINKSYLAKIVSTLGSFSVQSTLPGGDVVQVVSACFAYIKP
jgi:hypothetical protein